VQADSGKPGEGSFRAEKVTRKDAILTAVGLVDQGISGVTIIDEAGRAYSVAEFAQFYSEGDT
jgi:hypothetical protein